MSWIYRSTAVTCAALLSGCYPTGTSTDLEVIEVKIKECKAPIKFPKWMGLPKQYQNSNYWNLVKKVDLKNARELGIENFSARIDCFQSTDLKDKRESSVNYFERDCRFSKKAPYLKNVDCWIEQGSGVVYYYRHNQSNLKASGAKKSSGIAAIRFYYALRNESVIFNITGQFIDEKRDSAERSLRESLRVVGDSL